MRGHERDGVSDHGQNLHLGLEQRPQLGGQNGFRLLCFTRSCAAAPSG
jgi:hypothetical protein